MSVRFAALDTELGTGRDSLAALGAESVSRRFRFWSTGLLGWLKLRQSGGHSFPHLVPHGYSRSHSHHIPGAPRFGRFGNGLSSLELGKAAQISG